MNQNINMTVLIDNVASGPLAAEWGLSILITADDRTILLDTGASDRFARNAELLGIDLAAVDTGVLSHAHYDHADGMDAFFARNQKAPFLLREGSCENCYGVGEDVGMHYIGIRSGLLNAFADRIRYVSGVYALADGIWLVPHLKADYSSIALRNELYAELDGARVPDDFAHEQSLVVETKDGLIVFNSCSHTGPTNILEDIRQALGRSDVCAYVGGLHLYKLTDDELAVLCGEIRRTAIGHIFTGHCTGDHAFRFLKAELGDRIEQFSSGFSYRF